MIEIIGIVSTIFVLFSFFFHKEKNIRIVNIIGAILFVVYGIMIHSFSVWVLNSILIIVHFYNLVKIYRGK